MTQEKPEAFNNMFERLNRMARKDCAQCAQCGQVFQGLPETDSCTQCQYKQDHPKAQDMYWTWKRTGPGGWGIVAHWPDKEPPPNPGDRVNVHRKDGSSSTIVILKVGDLHYLPNRAGAAGVHGQINRKNERTHHEKFKQRLQEHQSPRRTPRVPQPGHPGSNGNPGNHSKLRAHPAKHAGPP